MSMRVPPSAKRLMGAIGCRRPHLTKLVDICSEIFVESAPNLCAFIYDAPNDVIDMAAPRTACHEVFPPMSTGHMFTLWT